MASQPGIEIPFSVEADGVEVTIEKLAASVLELSHNMETLQKTTQSIKAATVFTAFTAAVGLARDAFHGVTGALSDFSSEMDRATQFGSKFQNLSLQFNTSAESLQKLTAIGKPFGVSTEQIARSLSLVERNMGKLGPAFKKYGISQEEVAGKDAAGKFQLIGDAIAKIKDPSEQAAASFTLLKDRSGAFLKLIRDPQGVQGAIKDFEDFGLAVNNNAVGALDKLGNQRELIHDIFDSLKKNLLGAIASSAGFQEAIRIVVELFGKLSKFTHDNADEIRVWTNTAILVAADALVFLAKSVLPTVIDGLTVMALGLFGAKKAIDFVVAGLRLMFEIATKPSAAGKSLEEFKKRIAEIADETAQGVGKIVDANVALQNKAAEVGVAMTGLRQRISDAATANKPFAAELKSTGDQAQLSAEQLDKLAESTKAWGEKMAEVQRGVQNTFAVLADKDLPDVEKEINALGRAAVEETRKLEEEFRKLNEQRAKQQLPQQSRTSLDETLAKKAAETQAKIGEVFSKKAAADAKTFEDAIKGMTNSVVGDLDTITVQTNQLGFALRAIIDPAKGTQDALSALDFQSLDTAALDAAIKKMEELRAATIRAGGSIAQIDKDLKAAKAAERANAASPAVQKKILGEQAEAIKQQDIVSKALHQTRKEILATVAKEHGLTKEQAEKLLPKAVKNSEVFRDALEVAAQAAQLLGEGIGNVVGGMLSAAAAGEQAAASIQKARESGEGMGKALISAAGAALSVATNIAKASNTQNQKAATLGGAAKGAAFGAQFGLVGGIVGGVAGGLIGFFKSGQFRKIGKEAGKALGTELSDATVKKIQEDSKRLKISIASASLLNIGTAIEDSKKAASTFGPQIQSLIKGIADKSIPAKEGMEELAKSFGLVADEALKAGRVGDRALVGIIKQARASGVESPEIKAFVSDQLDKAATGFAKFAALFKKQTQEEIDKLQKDGTEVFAGLSDAAVTKLAENTGVIFGAVFNSLVSEKGIVAAVDQMKESFDTLKKRLSDTLGPDAVNKILGPFGAAFDTIGNEKLRPIFDGIDGLSQAMQGLANAGFLTTEQFTAMQQATKTLFDEAVAGGADMKTALLAVSPAIQAAISAAEQFGVPLDADTEKLKALAEENGITFKTDPQQQMLDVLTAIAEVLGAKLPDSIKKTKAAVSDMANTSNASFDSMGAGADAFSDRTRTRVTDAAIETSAAMNDAALKVTESFNAIALAGEESFAVVQTGSDALALSMTEDIPLAAEEAIKSLRELQNAAATPISVGGGGASGGTGGIKQVTANVSVNLGINENPLASAQTAAQMRAATVQWVGEAIEDRIPSIISAVENG
jgi:hypothetical protein